MQMYATDYRSPALTRNGCCSHFATWPSLVSLMSLVAFMDIPSQNPLAARDWAAIAWRFATRWNAPRFEGCARWRLRRHRSLPESSGETNGAPAR